MKKIRSTKTRPRLSVFKSNRGLYAQIINDDQGETLVGLSSRAAKGKTKSEIAFNLGQEIALLAKKKKISQVVFDRGRQRYLGRLKAVAEGARQGGLVF